MTANRGTAALILKLVQFIRSGQFYSKVTDKIKRTNVCAGAGKLAKVTRKQEDKTVAVSALRAMLK